MLTANKHAADNPGEAVPGAVYDLFLWANHPDQIVQPLHPDYFADPPGDLRLPPDPERELLWWGRQATEAAGDLVFEVPAGFAWCVVEHETVPGFVLDETVRCTAIISEQPPFGERSLALPEQREPAVPGVPGVPTLPVTGRETVPLLFGGVGAIVAGLAVLGSRRFLGTKPLTPF